MGGTIVFDNSCNLCNSLVRFIIKRDGVNRFRFVSLQSEQGKSMLLATGLPLSETDTAVYMRDGNYFLRSSAILNILKDLGGTWKILYAFIIIPAFIRDFIYRLIARNRYRLFGRRVFC